MTEDYFAGVDVGASATKVVVIDTKGKILGTSLKKTTTNLGKLAENALNEALKTASLARDSIRYIIATGYGRDNVKFAHEMKTEISCHSRGGRFELKEGMEPLTVVDIGGQDNKVIKLDKDGRIINFKMNRKCAAGTGAFLEEIALRLDTSPDALDELARGARKDIELGSFCTVFTSTEILEKIKEGESKENMVKGAFISVVKRIAEMEIFSGTVVLTGGVIAHNPLIGEILEKQLKVKVHIPKNAQFAGAFGAALYAKERFCEGKAKRGQNG